MNNMIKVLCLSLLLLSPYVAAEADTWHRPEDSGQFFDIPAFEALKKAHPGKNSFEIDLGNGEWVSVYENPWYGEIFRKYGPHYSRGRLFYKSNGQIEQDRAKFYFIPVESKKLYDKEGKLKLSEYYTPDDWVDRLVTAAQKNYAMNLSEPFLYNLQPIQNKEGKKALLLIHLNGEPLPPLGYYKPILYFTLIDFDNFTFIAKGEIHYEVTWLPPSEPGYPRRSDAKKSYFIDGKQLNIYELKW